MHHRRDFRRWAVLAGLGGTLLWGACLFGQGEKFLEGTDGELYYAPRIDLAGLTVDLDGELDEEAWQRAAYQSANGTAGAALDGEEDIDFFFAAAADTDYLYVAVEVIDDIRQAGDDFHALCDSWQDDSVELYIDAHNDGPDCATGGNCYRADDAQLTVLRESSADTDPDMLRIAGLAGRDQCDFTQPAPEVCRGVVVETDDGWTAELAIPLETIGNEDFAGVPDGTPTWSIDPSHGCRIGWSIQVNDDDDGGERDNKVFWALSEVAGGEDAWRNPGVFGKLVFYDPTRGVPKDPVSDLTCVRAGDGTMDLVWVNPPDAEPTDTVRILVDGDEVATTAGDTTATTLTEEQVPRDQLDHVIAVDNGTCTPASCTVKQSPFDDCGAITTWNILGAYGGTNHAPGEDAMRGDFLTDGATSQDDMAWFPGQTIETDFARAASSSYDDSRGSTTPTVQAFRGDTGYVDLAALFPTANTNVMAYLQCYVVNDTGEEMEVYWADGSDDSIQVKLNGMEVWIANIGRGTPNSCNAVDFPLDVSPDGFLFLDPLLLEPGENNLLVKVFQGTGGWGFIGRFQDEAGNPITEGLKISLAPSEAVLPVLDLTCLRQEDGSVLLSWTNPETADPSRPIHFEVDGADLAETVPGDSTSASLTGEQVPPASTQHVITVVNDSGIGQNCILARELATEPPELAEPGGTLYINAGASTVTDTQGRIWNVDDAYLAPGHPPTNVAGFGGEIIDRSLLDDPDVPNEVVLEERWCDCTIHYQMGVPDDSYIVTVYFSENCTGCVSASLGGTSGDAAANRLFDVEVQDQKVEAYSPADAAEEPQDDGIGSTLKATELVFEVAVEDGLLDISVVDRGPGNPPENAAVKGILIEREGGGGATFHRGDPNDDGALNITDGIYILNFLFLGGPAPTCLESADPNDDGVVNITDGIMLLNFLFLGGPGPVSPGSPTEPCGPDRPGSVDLGCSSYTNC